MTLYKLPFEAERVHLRLSEDSRRMREQLWEKSGGPPWMRRSQQTDVRRRKLRLLMKQ